MSEQQDTVPQDKHVAFFADDPKPEPIPSKDLWGGVWVHHGWYWEFVPNEGSW